jgi:hypothetical protein
LGLDRVYVAVSDLKLNAVAPGFPGAQTSPFNPKVALLMDNKVGGGLHALNLETGEERWQTRRTFSCRRPRSGSL